MKPLKTLLILSCLLFGAFLFCSFTPGYYEIKAIIPDKFNGKEIVLIELGTKKILGKSFVKNGQFKFKGKVKSAKFCHIIMGGNTTLGHIILENGSILVEAGSMLGRKISGTDLNNKWAETNEILKEQGAAKGYVQIFNENRDNAVGALALFFARNFLSPTDFVAYYDGAEEVVQQNTSLLSIIEHCRVLSKTDVGKPYIDFAMKTIDGSNVKLSDYVGKGKYVLIYFWASWCGFCKMEYPVINGIHHDFQGDKFDILAVAIRDENAKIKRSIKEHNMDKWIHICDYDGLSMELYGIKGPPHTILLDPEGNVIARDLRGKELRAKIAEILE